MNTQTQTDARSAAVRRVLFGVLVFNISVTLLKIGVGLAAGALAVVADGFHSLVDVASNLISLAMLHLSAREADARHPYGYQRYETLGALFIGVLMMLAAAEIAWQAIEHWRNGITEVEPITLYLVALALVANSLIAWLETHQGRKWQSELLLADAAHTKSDLWVTGSVVASLIGVRLGLHWLDPLAALLIALLIVRTAWEILTTAAQYLTDASVIDPEAVARVAAEIPGVLDVYHIRSRGRPGAAFVDLRVRVPAGMGTQQAHALADEIERRVVAEVPDVIEAIVHVEPALADEEPRSPWFVISTGLRRIADGLGLGIHEIYINALPHGAYSAEMHLEFPGEISLAKAHEQTQAFIRRVRAEIPTLAEVVVHPEPLPARVLPAEEDEGGLAEQVRAFAAEHCTKGKISSVHLRRSETHVTAIVKCLLPPEMPLDKAHSLADDLQRAVLIAFPTLTRAIVEVEPTPPDFPKNTA